MALIRTNLVVLGMLLLSACAPFNYSKVDAPLAQEKVSEITEKPKLAIVMSSGGPRGYAHIGILRVLEEYGIRADLMVGSSVGSLIGALWSAGYSAEEIARLSKEGGPLTLFDPSIFADRGWIKGQRLQDYVNELLDDQPIEALERELIVVATRSSDNAAIFFQQGNTGVAVRASSAVPGIISPVGINGVEYVDANQSLPLAVKAAYEANASYVIAIDVTPKADAAPPGTSASKLDREQKQRDLITPEAQLADFLFHPNLDYDAGPWRSYFESSEQVGEQIARQRIKELIHSIETCDCGITLTPHHKNEG